MRLKLIIILFIILYSSNINAQNTNGEYIKIRELGINKNDSVVIKMDLYTSKLNINDNKVLIIEPLLIKGMDTTEFPSVGVYGRYRYYYYQRNNISIQNNINDIKYSNSSLPDKIFYTHSMASEKDEFNGALIALRKKEYGCCNKILNENITILDTCKSKTPFSFKPKYIFVKPEIEIIKTRSETFSTYIDFPVSQILIKESYRNNKEELNKLIQSISNIIDDKDITINSISLKGYASPESPYSNNKRLAEGRTISVMNYIKMSFAPKIKNDIISTSYEPENWNGLRDFVENSNLTNKEQISAIISRNIDLDEKERIIKTNYPLDYKYLLRECYPALRKTDYTINYTIKSFTDIKEIKRVLNEAYYKLSLSEFYTLSKEYHMGSNDFNKIFLLAAKVYPSDETANINAANVAMSKGDLIQAEKFLQKAGDTIEAIYARGILEALNKNYSTAKMHFNKIKDKLPEANEALNILLSF